jgi:histone-lysine N-methyltransferase SETMAR
MKAPSHTSIFTQQFLMKHKMAVIPHPPYSPDWTPCDFFQFPKMKLKLKGHWFDANEEIQAKSQRVLDTLTGKGLPGSIPKMQEMVGPVSTCGRELLQE